MKRLCQLGSATVTVELFGVPRLATGRRHLVMQVSRKVGVGQLAAALAEHCPELVGNVILEDLSGLEQSYTLNLNGTSFMSDEHVDLRTGDTLLLFSSQAGG